MAPVEMTAIASRVASICDLIDDFRFTEQTMSASRVAAISAMIHDIALKEATRSSRRRRKQRRMDSARSYKETRTLGKGGFGVVTEARHRVTGQTVALKTPLQHGFSVGLLLREACFMAACRDHPNTVALRDIVRVPDTRDYSIVMEYVGPTLHHVLRDRMNRPFTESEVRGIMRQLLSGAAAMHRHRIIHRDIKPRNIFVVRSGDDDALVVKIGDYGLAVSTAEWNRNGATGAYIPAGTRSYMAPEILLWKPDYDTRVDTWSLGCVMAELLTGKRLFEMADTDTETDQLYKIFNLLGVPGNKAYKEFKSSFSSLTDKVQVWRRQQQQRGRYRSGLRQMFPKKTLSKEGFEVLSGLLTCCPSKRLDAAAALRFPWFADTDDHSPAPAPAPAPAPTVAAVSKSGGAAGAASIWALASCSWQLALACLGCAVRSFRPKAMHKS